MEKKNLIVLGVIGVFVLNLVLFVGMYVMVEKTTDRVIDRLKKSYMPGGNVYGPVLDPDKVDLSALPRVAKTELTSENETWLTEWEQQRR